MKKAVVLAALIVFFLSGSLTAKETLRIGVLDFPPFYYAAHGGEPCGFLLDYLKAVVEKAGYDHEVFGYPARRLFKNLREGEVHLYAGLKGVDAYDQHVLYSKKKITEIDLRIYTRKDTPLLKTREALKGKRIMVISGYNYGGFLDYLTDPQNNIAIENSNDHHLIFKKLLARRADYVLDYYMPSEYVLKQMNVSDVQSHSLLILDAFLILSLQTPHATQVMERLEKVGADIILDNQQFIP